MAMTGCHYTRQIVRHLSRRFIALAVAAFPLTVLLLSPSGAAAVDVWTQHNDNFRTGANLNEFTLTTSNVNTGQFGKLFARAVDGQIYAQPLYVHSLTISNRTRNVIYVCTEHNSVFAFDADDPAASNALWQVNVGPSVSYTDVDSCTDLAPEIGITSTPVIDLVNNTIFVSAKTKESGNFFYRLHALDLLSGQEKYGGPVLIQASAPGSGDGSVGGTNTFNALHQLNRPGLLLLSNVVYLAFGSHCDWTPYHGWLLGYNATNLQQVSTLNTTPNGNDGAIWSCGMGPAVDPAGNIYVMTGNGTFDATNGVDFGQSFLKLSTSNGPPVIVDSFTPHDAATLNLTDLDIGTGGPVLMPGTNILVGLAKTGAMYVLNENHLGNFVTSSDTNTVQVFQPVPPADCIGQCPVYWNGPTNQFLFLWTGGDVLRALKFNGATFQTTPLATNTVAQNDPGGGLSLSANGNATGTAVLWGTWGTPGAADGALYAYDAGNVAHELWDSSLIGRDALGSLAKFCAPTIANGKVYVATASGNLVVYGLLPSPPQFQVTGISLSNNDVMLAWTAFGATTNYVQATAGDGGGYSTNFTTISPPIGIPGTGPTATNYIDAGGATNQPARYYRVSMVGPLAIDNAADPAYSGGWPGGSNGGRGYGPWTLTASSPIQGAGDGFFIGFSTNNGGFASPGIDVNGKSWGIYANNNNYTAAYRPFLSPVPVGGTLRVDMDNGYISSNSAVGFVLRNGNAAASYTNYNTGSRLEFLYIGYAPTNSYQVVDAAARHAIGVPFTTTGLRLYFTLGTNDTYTLTVVDNATSATDVVLHGTLAGATNSTLDSIAVYNRNAGDGPPFDAFFNSLQINGP